MSSTNYISQAGVFFSCNEKKEFVTEQMVPEHILTHVYSGRISIVTANKAYSLSAGQTALFGRNQLAKFTKEPVKNESCESVTIFFTQPFLQKFYATKTLVGSHSPRTKILQLKTTMLLDNLFRSIGTCLNMKGTFIANEQVQLKIHEALTLVREIDSNVDVLLSDFSEPHKIDLAGFMQKNFMFNIPISKFAYLTGRSLATFKRDFKKVFGTSPQKWLTEKRLEQAHFLIAEQQKRPSQALIEAGFENFSHFSNAFKQFFGYSPSSILSSLAK
ncbi:helix-turn-helix domain-containing protein [Abyssalbus ytuae]|uniref:AraC family transcriptional regulator n=1 Tax=Abyssalbus ytuae TaxID=2926907 RepID=A0A9E7CU26_9FLAO|nr:AraC family transcriptional regulator [Abyssalbus ytuae]UOB17442.1 AraC family transcriptional regulator [Abyssalbus ytuae]